jgi:hypothetical protein
VLATVARWPTLDECKARILAMTDAELAASLDLCLIGLDKWTVGDLLAIADGADEAVSRELWGDGLDAWDWC